MSAITGIYRPAHRLYGQWAVNWLHSHYDRKRHVLAQQLVLIRREHGSQEAREYRNYLLWLGCYPVRIRPRGAKS